MDYDSKATFVVGGVGVRTLGHDISIPRDRDRRDRLKEGEGALGRPQRTPLQVNTLTEDTEDGVQRRWRVRGRSKTRPPANEGRSVDDEWRRRDHRIGAANNHKIVGVKHRAQPTPKASQLNQEKEYL